MENVTRRFNDDDDYYYYHYYSVKIYTAHYHQKVSNALSQDVANRKVLSERLTE